MANKKPKLTVKEINFIKGLVAGKSQTQAALEATNASTYQSAATQAGRMLKKDEVQEALEKAFKKHKITMDAAIAPIGKALRARKVVIHGKDDEAFAEEVEDVELQLKGSDRALKLMNVYRQDGAGSTVNINFGMVADEQRRKYGFEEEDNA